MIIDCNKCHFVDITEQVQNLVYNKIKRKLPHICKFYKRQVKHEGYHPFIVPCWECIKDEYVHYIEHYKIK